MLIVIDIWKKYRTAKGKQNDYDEDYNALVKVQELASRNNIAILVIHHTIKSEVEEEISGIGGTFGLTGAADAWWVIKGTNSGKVLYGEGRDIEEFSLALSFNKDTCRWECLGNAEDVNRSDIRKAIIAVLEKAGKPMKPKQIADAIRPAGVLSRDDILKHVDKVKQRLADLCAELNARIRKIGYGEYEAICKAPLNGRADDGEPF